MSLPNFTASASVYVSKRRYRTARNTATSFSHIIPALPGCQSCEDAWDQCFDVLQAGGRYASAPVCRLLNRCNGACEGPTSGSGGSRQEEWLDSFTCTQACSSGSGAESERCRDMFC